MNMNDLDQILELIAAVLLAGSGLLALLTWMESSLDSDRLQSGAERRWRSKHAILRR